MPKRSTRDNDRYRVEHMISFCEKIIQFSHESETGSSEFEEMRVLALLRLFETLGEAANRVSKELREAHPEVPWLEAADTRNRLIHGYDDLDLDILWHSAKFNIPPLLDQLIALRDELDEPNT